MNNTATFQQRGEIPVVSDAPHTDGNTDDADNHQGYEHQDPLIQTAMETFYSSLSHLVSPGVEVVSRQELEHKEQQMHSETNQHGLVLKVLLIVES